MTAQPLWTLDAMAQAMRAARSGALPPSVPGISIDTRTIAPGEAFFAIKGDSRDGHAFVPHALKAGAALGMAIAFIVVLCMSSNYVIVRHRRDVGMAPALAMAGVLSAIVALPFASPGTLETQHMPWLLVTWVQYG